MFWDYKLHIFLSQLQSKSIFASHGMCKIWFTRLLTRMENYKLFKPNSTIVSSMKDISI